MVVNNKVNWGLNPDTPDYGNYTGKQPQDTGDNVQSDETMGHLLKVKVCEGVLDF